MSKIKLTYTLPSALLNEMRQRIVSNGYGLRGKSRWVEEAIHLLFEKRNFAYLVNVSDEMAGFDKMDTVCVNDETKVLIDAKVIAIKKQYLSMEGVQSRIIRTAIMQRLLNG